MPPRPIDSLIEDIYEAALSPALWPHILNDIREGIGASAFSLFSLAISEEQKPELLTYNIDPEWSLAYREYWWQHDAWVQGAIDRGLVLPGLTLSGSMLVDSKSFQKSVWLNEALRHQDIGDLLTTTLWTSQEPGPELILSFYRDLRSDPFGNAEIRQLASLSGHLRRALQLTLSRTQLHENIQHQSAILDGISQPVVILDSQRTIISVNAPGERFLSTTKGILKIRNRRVTALGLHAIPKLDEAFEWAHAHPGQPIAIAFVISKNAGLPTLGNARLLKLREAQSRNFQRVTPDRFMLQIELPQNPSPETLCAFADLFGLTQGEFRVLELLIEDLSPQLIADRLGISLPTVRTHLQRLRQKTGTRRYGELIRLVLSAGKRH